MGKNFDKIWCIFTIIVLFSSSVKCDDGNCYGSGSIALSVVLSVIITLIIVGAFHYWIKNRHKTEQLILETDPEKGKAEYAFDNQGFKDTTLTNPSTFSKPESEKSSKQKWTSHWASGSGRKIIDDSILSKNDEIKIVSLRSHDFAGLGFSICGNMKEGIYIKDVLHRGPAYESGKLNPGDRISSVTINFENIVQEDAQNILSYASPYEVIIEARNGKVGIEKFSKKENPIFHPVYRSSSSVDMQKMSKKFFRENSNRKSLNENEKNSILNSEHLKNQLEKKITPMETEVVKIEEEKHRKSENHHKFGVKVFPTPTIDQSPKSQNDNNSNIEKIKNIDEIDRPEIENIEIFKRNGSLNGSGLKRDSNGIPQELPTHMLNAAVAARRNRKSFEDNDEETTKLRKSKGKAPQPPSSSEEKSNYNSDSDVENDLKTSTIELNSSDITIHNEENRKTASTGDLTKIQRTNKNSGTLERAQSLDITDAGVAPQIRRIEDSFEDLFGKAMNREPRLSLILDGLNTFQRNRLKKSTEWGNLEDAILRSGDDNSMNSNSSEVEFDAVVNKIKEIRRESLELENRQIKNQIWPSETGKIVEIECRNVETKPIMIQPKITVKNEGKTEDIQNEIWPKELENVENSVPNITRIHRRQQIPVEEISPPPPNENETFEEVGENSNSNKRNSETGEFYEFNNTDESKSSILNSNELFIYNERFGSLNDTNISDDLKVSRHTTLNSLEIPKSDDVKSKESLKSNVSNVLISTENGSSSLHSLEFSVNDNEIPSLNDEKLNLDEDEDDDDELYKTAMNIQQPEKDITTNGGSKVTITTPDLIKNVTITEAINTLNNDYDNDSSSLTFVTEIQVIQPENEKISKIEINKNLDNEFERYIKNFEDNKNDDDTVPVEKIDEIVPNLDLVEKELNKIEEIVEEQLKKLPEMRFTTTSYESASSNKQPEKRQQSQIEMLRSNFEKSPNKNKNVDINTFTVKSRIPISTSFIKTPPMSPERRDSKNLDINNENEMFELITSSTSSLVHSTPKYQKTGPNKNVTITSIRNNSKIPSGLPVLSGKSRKNDENDIIGNNSINTFKQWVFEPNNTITNISLSGHKSPENK